MQTDLALRRENLLTVRMSDEEWAQLEAVARRSGLSASELVRSYIRAEYERYFGIERAVAALIKHAPGGATAEEIAGVFAALTGKACSPVEARALCEASPSIERTRAGKYRLKPGN
jgi:hypothetical protein